MSSSRGGFRSFGNVATKLGVKTMGFVCLLRLIIVFIRNASIVCGLLDLVFSIPFNNDKLTVHLIYIVNLSVIKRLKPVSKRNAYGGWLRPILGVQYGWGLINFVHMCTDRNRCAPKILGLYLSIGLDNGLSDPVMSRSYPKRDTGHIRNESSIPRGFKKDNSPPADKLKQSVVIIKMFTFFGSNQKERSKTIRPISSSIESFWLNSMTSQRFILVFEHDKGTSIEYICMFLDSDISDLEMTARINVLSALLEWKW